VVIYPELLSAAISSAILQGGQTWGVLWCSNADGVWAMDYWG